MDRLDKSLDEIIQSSRKVGTNRSKKNNVRPSPYTKPKKNNVNREWKHDLFEANKRLIKNTPISPVSIRSNLSNPTLSIKGHGGPSVVAVYNLHFDATPEDIKSFFSGCGDISRVDVSYDKAGRSTGYCEITFMKKSDAITAISRFSNKMADGRILKLELIEKPLTKPSTTRQTYFNKTPGPKSMLSSTTDTASKSVNRGMYADRIFTSNNQPSSSRLVVKASNILDRKSSKPQTKKGPVFKVTL